MTSRDDNQCLLFTKPDKLTRHDNNRNTNHDDDKEGDAISFQLHPGVQFSCSFLLCNPFLRFILLTHVFMLSFDHRPSAIPDLSIFGVDSYRRRWELVD